MGFKSTVSFLTLPVDFCGVFGNLLLLVRLTYLRVSVFLFKSIFVIFVLRSLLSFWVGLALLILPKLGSISLLVL